MTFNYTLQQDWAQAHRARDTVQLLTRETLWIWIWILVGRAPNWDITPTRCAPTERLGWLLNRAEESADTTDWGRAFHSIAVLMPDFIPPSLWPINNPELNPVDYHVWNVLQERVNRENIRTLDELQQRITEEWAHGPAHHRQRCQAVASASPCLCFCKWRTYWTFVVQESLANALVSARQPCTSKTDFDMMK